MKLWLYISCWEEHGGAPGIRLLRFDSETGKVEDLGRQFPELSCGCTAVDRERKILYIANEIHENPDYVKGGGGFVWAFKIDPATGELTKLSRVESCCPCPCYLALTPDGKHLLCANHSGFNAVTRVVRGADSFYYPQVVYDDAFVGLFRLNDDGSIGPLVDISLHNRYSVEGRSLHAHPHTAVLSPDGNLVACNDKGDAHIYMYRLEGEKLVLASDPYADTLGSSPRYGVFHPKKLWYFVNHERNMRVSSFSYNENGVLTPINEISVLPAGIEGDAAEIRKKLHIGETPSSVRTPLEQQGFVISRDGAFLYDALNGADAVSVLRVEADGSLTLIQTKAIPGRWVRGCALSPDGRFLVATCLQSGGVHILPVRPDGTLGDSIAHAEVHGGSYATFFPAE